MKISVKAAFNFIFKKIKSALAIDARMLASFSLIKNS
jgi:hypothetical protein